MADSDPKRSTKALREDVESGLRFLHTLGMQSKSDLVGLTTRLFALLEELVASGTLDLRSYEDRREKVSQREAERMSREGHVRVMMDNTEDKYAMPNLPEIDCASLIHLCKAKCCAFGFALSFQDLDERIVEWDYAAPYHIRQRSNGYCVHNDSETHTCQVYEHRPAVCRGYDCRQDERVWKDFERRIPAGEDETNTS